MKQLQIAFMASNWGNILYLFASSVFLIAKNDLTGYLSAIFYLSGSFLYALSDFIRILCSSGLNKKVNLSFSIADSMLTIGSIFFVPSLNMAIVGNWIFEIAGWMNLINVGLKFWQLYHQPTVTWKVDLFSKIFTAIGVIMFIAGNIILINNSSIYFTKGFILFTIGSVGFVIGGSFPINLGTQTPQVQEKQIQQIQPTGSSNKQSFQNIKNLNAIHSKPGSSNQILIQFSA